VIPAHASPTPPPQQFAGDWEKIESLNEMVELDEAVRSAPRADLKHEAP